MRALRVSGASPFFLIVKIKLVAHGLDSFQDQMPNLRQAFSENGFNLLLAGIREDKDGEHPVAVHLWHMPSADQLLKGMSMLADNVPYTRIDDLILNENQDLGTPSRHYVDFESELLQPWQTRRQAKLSAAEHRSRDRYLIVTETVNSTDLAEYGARYESRLQTFNAAHGWELGEGLLHITGELNRVSRAWVVPKHLSYNDAIAILKTSPGAGCVVPKSVTAYFMAEARYETTFGAISIAPAPKAVRP